MECTFSRLEEICTWSVLHRTTQRIHSLFMLHGLSFTELPSEYTRSSCFMACPSPNYPANTFALHASAHFHTLTPAFCLLLRLHFPCLLLTVSEGVSEGTVTYIGWANWRPTEILTISVHCRPGQCETQSHVTIYVSLSTTCLKVLKKIQKSVHVLGAVCLQAQVFILRSVR